MKLVRDGVHLSFELAGTGTPDLVFVHGLGGDASHFAAQLAHYCDRERVLIVELRGHGASDAPRQTYPIEVFADDIAWLCDTLELHRPVIVGQGLGGNTALEIAARRPELAAAVVLLDSSLLLTPEETERLTACCDGLHGPDWQDWGRRIIAEACQPTDRCRAQVEARFLATPQHVLAAACDGVMAWEQTRARICASACRVPVLYVEASRPLVDLERFARLCPQLITAKATGSGHFLAMEVPEQVDAMLDRFLLLYRRQSHGATPHASQALSAPLANRRQASA